MFAGWERVDGHWQLVNPGVLTTGQWMFSIAESFLAFITVRTCAGQDKILFLGANPRHIYGQPVEELPATDIAFFIGYFARQFPCRAEQVTAFLETYAVNPGAEEPTYTSHHQAGDDLFREFCQSLDIGLPEQMEP